MIYRYFATIEIRMIEKSEGVASGIEDLRNYSPSADCLALLRTSKKRSKRVTAFTPQTYLYSDDQRVVDILY